MGIFTKIFIWSFLCIPRVVLFITTYFGHSTTKNSLKYQIWNFAFWVDKMSQNRAISIIRLSNTQYICNIMESRTWQAFGLLFPSPPSQCFCSTCNVLYFLVICFIGPIAYVEEINYVMLWVIDDLYDPMNFSNIQGSIFLMFIYMKSRL